MQFASNALIKYILFHYIFNRFEKKANRMLMKASQTLEMSTGFTIGLKKGNYDTNIYFITILK